ncbi:hypothetical protein TH5_03615 [Thalassospira xianhensis MCCC 1A02616]|uniref:Uncharacterized protein n=1 Tax=Thalassospira xianhensis MCCC 1A02616 TaxID=1177929 RepID=A0A367UGQ6_9PROT|nr:hypothetical protein TH5_03615 [Thalassospira xianhensis MCCC 1A02616]
MIGKLSSKLGKLGKLAECAGFFLSSEKWLREKCQLLCQSCRFLSSFETIRVNIYGTKIFR